MATYRSIAATETDANSPVTTTLMVALAENPVAIAEGASGAPRVSPAAQGVTVISGSASGTVTLTGFAPYEGTHVTLQYVNSVAAASNIQISLSDDGVSYSTPLTIATSTGNDFGSSMIDVNFSDGAVTAVASGGLLFTGLTPAATADVTHVRFTITGGGTVTIAAMATPTAGTVA